MANRRMQRREANIRRSAYSSHSVAAELDYIDIISFTGHLSHHHQHHWHWRRCRCRCRWGKLSISINITTPIQMKSRVSERTSIVRWATNLHVENLDEFLN